MKENIIKTDKWTTSKMPDQTGRIAVVTGANSGLGLISTRELARKGARVVMACRNMEKAEKARDDLRAELPESLLDVMELNLADLSSVRRFTEKYKNKYGRLDILLNNAGLMAIPYAKTKDGFEMQFGTNHLGHFALTGRLMDIIVKTRGSRIVTVSSAAAALGKINFDNLMNESSYNRWRAYGTSKLANILFAYELRRRLERGGKETVSIAAHPGSSATGLRTDLMDSKTPFLHRIMSRFFEIISQSAYMGALPQLYAATESEPGGCAYIGPNGLFQRAGYPACVRSPASSYDEALAARLWAVSEELTGVKYDFGE